MKNVTLYLLSSLTILLCSCSNSNTTQIAENTFVYKSKVFKLVDNELTEVANLDDKAIRKFEILKPTKKDFGTYDLSYVKKGVTSELNGLYRGNTLYFKLSIFGINDLKENYAPGAFTIHFADEFGFILHSTEIPTNELTGLVDGNHTISSFEYNGKTEMSTDINNAIKHFSVSSTVKEKSNKYGYGW